MLPDSITLTGTLTITFNKGQKNSDMKQGDGKGNSDGANEGPSGSSGSTGTPGQSSQTYVVHDMRHAKPGESGESGHASLVVGRGANSSGIHGNGNGYDAQPTVELPNVTTHAAEISKEACGAKKIQNSPRQTPAKRKIKVINPYVDLYEKDAECNAPEDHVPPLLPPHSDQACSFLVDDTFDDRKTLVLGESDSDQDISSSDDEAKDDVTETANAIGNSSHAPGEQSESLPNNEEPSAPPIDYGMDSRVNDFLAAFSDAEPADGDTSATAANADATTIESELLGLPDFSVSEQKRFIARHYGTPDLPMYPDMAQVTLRPTLQCFGRFEYILQSA